MIVADVSSHDPDEMTCTENHTRSARRRHIARMARTPSETRKTTTLSIAAEFRRLRPGIQAERKSLISWAEQF